MERAWPRRPLAWNRPLTAQRMEVWELRIPLRLRELAGRCRRPFGMAYGGRSVGASRECTQLKQTSRRNEIICDSAGARCAVPRRFRCPPADHRMSVEVRLARDEAEVAAALALRAEVFCEEQGVPLDADRDGLDDDALHVVAIDGGELVGTCRVVLDGAVQACFGRLCVRRDARRRGLAGALLREAEREARAAGAPRLQLHAQTSALELSRRSGYESEGEPFDEEGIEHLRMSRSLS